MCSTYHFRISFLKLWKLLICDWNVKLYSKRAFSLVLEEDHRCFKNAKCNQQHSLILCVNEQFKPLQWWPDPAVAALVQTDPYLNVLWSCNDLNPCTFSVILQPFDEIIILILLIRLIKIINPRIENKAESLVHDSYNDRFPQIWRDFQLWHESCFLMKVLTMMEATVLSGNLNAALYFFFLLGAS